MEQDYIRLFIVLNKHNKNELTHKAVMSNNKFYSKVKAILTYIAKKGRPATKGGENKKPAKGQFTSE